MQARKQLRAWRRAEGLTQYGLGRWFDISKQFVGMIERGDRNPGLGLANRFKAVCGIPTEAWDDPAPEDPPAPTGDGTPQE